MTYNDINSFSIIEINNIYNETKMDIFMLESDYFLDIINQRSFGSLNESVIQESFKEKAAVIWNSIKKFFTTIRDAIKRFFSTIIEAITRSYDNQKVDPDSEKIIEVEDKSDNKAIAAKVDQTSKAFSDLQDTKKQVMSNIRANHDKMDKEIKDIKSSSNKSTKDSMDASFDKINSDLNKLLTSGEKKEDKKNNEPNFSMKGGTDAHTDKEIVGKYAVKKMQAAANKQPLMIEKKGNLFDYMKKKFDIAINYISKNYKGEEKKFGTITHVSYINSRINAKFGDIYCEIEGQLEKLDKLDYKYAMQVAMDNSDHEDNYGEKTKAKFEKRFNRAKDYFEAIKDECQTEEFYVNMFFNRENESFDQAFNNYFLLDKEVSVTNKNLDDDIINQIKLNIFDKNRYIKITKTMYNETMKLINEYESRGKKIKEIIDSGVEFYNYIGKDVIDTYLKMVSNFSKYIIRYNSKAQNIIKQNRVKSYEIFNNVIGFYNQIHN